MNKMKLTILTLITAVSILFLVTPLIAAPNAPTGFNAVNFGGPIRLAWTDSTGGVGTVTYTIYRVEADSTTIPSDPPSPVLNGVGYGSYAQTVTFGITSTSYIDTTVGDGIIYYYFVTGNDTTGESDPASLVSSATSSYPDAEYGYFISLSATETTIHYENSTLANPSTGTIITYTITDTDQAGNRFIASKINYDIIDNFSDSSIYKKTQEISGGSGGISTGQITWDGRWFNTLQYTKHNGSYTVEVWATDFAGTDHPKSTITINVHVVHINDIILIYTDYGTDTVAHGGPYRISYQLTQPAFTTVRIYNSNGTVDNDDDTLVRTIIHEVPRDGEMQTRDVRCTDFWDLKDDNGNKVAHAKYRFQIDAYQNHFEALSTRDSADSAGWEFAYDFRIVDISSIGITENNALAKIKYTITDDANIKIIICNAETTFTVVAGEPIPSSNPEKTFNFYRNAGSQEESWDGNSENGTVLPNGLYVFAVSAKDMYGNHAIDANNNDLPIYGNITIDRTGSQVSTDSTPPTVTSVDPAHGAILSASFTTVTVVLDDETSGSGVDLDGTTITLADPAGNSVTGTQTNNGTDTILLTFIAQDTNGTYTIRITPKDKTGNTGAQQTVQFTLNVDSLEPTLISTSPANNAIITAAFTEVSAKLQDETGGSGISLSSSTITLTDPDGNIVSGTKSDNGVDTIILTVSPQTNNGTYIIIITPQDTAGNISTAYTVTFLNLSKEFKDTVFIYPNPIKTNKATFAYTITAAANVTIEVYTITGDKIWSRSISETAPGSKNIVWNCTNDNGNLLANDLYLYILKAEYDSNNEKIVKNKFIVAK